MKLSQLTIALTALSLFTLFQPAQAVIACKGLESTDCSKQSHCSWTSAYTRKDGKKVNGYCRTARKQTSQARSNAAEKYDKTAKKKTANKQR